jgi:hypothetical protein
MFASLFREYGDYRNVQAATDHFSYLAKRHSLFSDRMVTSLWSSTDAAWVTRFSNKPPQSGSSGFNTGNRQRGITRPGP